MSSFPRGARGVLWGGDGEGGARFRGSAAEEAAEGGEHGGRGDGRRRRGVAPRGCARGGRRRRRRRAVRAAIRARLRAARLMVEEEGGRGVGRGQREPLEAQVSSFSETL